MAHIPLSLHDLLNKEKENREIIYHLMSTSLNCAPMNLISSPSSGRAKFDVVQFRKKIKNYLNTDELTFLVMMFMVRGNNVTKIVLTVKEKSAKKLITLIKKLHIESQARNNRTVTLKRIAISFPEVMAVVLKQLPNIPGRVQLDDIRQTSGDPEYPSLARESALACFIPQGIEDTYGMLNVFLLPNMVLTETIHNRDDTWQSQDAADKLSTSKAFQTKAYNSALFNENERIALAVKFGMIISKEELKPTVVWENAANCAKKWLVETYGSCY